MYLWSERPRPKTLSTDNGEVEVKDCVRFYLDELGESIDALLLDQTPPVLSVGARCMKLGYSFHWPAGKSPYLVHPDQSRIDLEVIGNVPYLRPSCTSLPQSGACTPASDAGDRSSCSSSASSSSGDSQDAEAPAVHETHDGGSSAAPISGAEPHAEPTDPANNGRSCDPRAVLTDVSGPRVYIQSVDLPMRSRPRS